MTSDTQTLAQAVQHHQSGELEQAEQGYRKILRLHPRHADTLHLLGLVAHQRHEHQQAVEYIGKAIEANDQVAPYYSHLGAAYKGLGDLSKAAECYRKALRLDPAFAGGWYNLGMTLEAQGETDDAIEAFRKAIKHAPDLARAHNNLGNLLLMRNRHTDAIESFRQAVRLAPTSADFHYNLGNALQQEEQHEAAVRSFRESIRLNADCSEAFNNLGASLKDLEQFEEAGVAFEEALRLDPDFGMAVINRASVYYLLGDIDTAQSLYKKGLAIHPDHPAGWLALSKILYAQDKYGEAMTCCQRVIDSNPGDIKLFFELGNLLMCMSKFEDACQWYEGMLKVMDGHGGAWCNLGNARKELGNQREAERCYRRAIEVAPQQVEARANLADLLRSEGEMDESLEQFEKVKQLSDNPRYRIQAATSLPPVYQSREDLLAWRHRFETEVDALVRDEVTYDPSTGPAPHCFYLAYQGFNDRALLQKIASRYRSTFQPTWDIEKRRRHDDGRIHVGFISRHFKNHTISTFMRGLISKLGRDRFHVTVITPSSHSDQNGTFLQKQSDEYLVSSENVPIAHSRIDALELDALFYSDIGMDPFTYALAFSRLAPVQCVTWGHPSTTGIDTIDYFLSSELLETEDADDHYSERLVRLPTLPTYYFRPALSGVVKSRRQFQLPSASRLYLCPQTLFKLHPDFDALLLQILDRDRKARIVLIEGVVPRWASAVKERLQLALGPAFERVCFVPTMSTPDFINLVAICDVMLDPIHFGGGNTNYQAFAMGMPIVTWPSPYLRGRVAGGLYRQMQITDCIANNAEEYVDLAVRLANERELNQHIHQKILESNSVLFEDTTAVSAIENFLTDAVQDYRQNGPAASSSNGVRHV